MPTSDYTPDVQAVADFIRFRTRDAGGNEVGTFDNTTNPDAAEVQRLIQAAVDELSPRLGVDVPDSGDPDDPDALRRAARRLVALLSAMNVELTFFPEQIGTSRSPYNELQERLDRGMNTIIEAINGPGDGGSTDGSSVANPGGGFASYYFPEDAGGMIGWDTRF